MHHRTIVVATRNRHKIDELQSIIAGKFEWRTLADFVGVPPLREDGATFNENAIQKAEQVCRWLASQAAISPAAGLCVLADDSGLEVDALEGAPGVYSARFAAGDAGFANNPDAANNARLIGLLERVPETKRGARFRCVLALYTNRPVAGGAPAWQWHGPELFEGACEGRLTVTPRGFRGFGYDPLFIPLGYDRSFAELTDAEKNSISHRARAAQKLKERLAAF